MNRFIGGEIECDLNLFSQPLRDSRVNLPMSHQIMLDTGRSAILVALQNIARRTKIRKAWLPAYCCEAVLAPFRALGFQVNFYSMGGDLMTPSGLPDPERNMVFLFIHYFGKKNHALIRWLQKVNVPHRFFVIEDCVHASLNQNVGLCGDYAVTSFRKFLPQPDGAILASTTPIRSELALPNEAFVTGKLIGKLLRQQKQSEGLFLRLLKQAETSLDLSLKPRQMSSLSVFLMQRTDLSQVRQKRRRNWELLHKLFDVNGLHRVFVPVFHQLRAGEIPLGFPVRVVGKKRDDLRRFLAGRSIFCSVHWEMAHLPKSKRWAQEFDLSRSILTLPVDQRMDREIIRYLIKTLRMFLRRTK